MARYYERERGIGWPFQALDSKSCPAPSQYNAAFGNFIPGVLIPLLALVAQSQPFPLPEQSVFPTALIR